MHLKPTQFKSIAVSMCALIVCGAFFFLPWKKWAELRLDAELERRGFSGADVSIDHIGIHGITFDGVHFGGDPGISLEKLSVGYSLIDIFKGNIDAVSLSNLTISAGSQNGSWQLDGVRLPSSPKEEGSLTPSLSSELGALPLNKLTIDDSSLQLHSQTWQLSAPFRLEWQKKPMPSFAVSLSNATFKARNYQAATAFVSLTASLQPETDRWQGLWAVKNVTVAGLRGFEPVLDGSGSISLFNDSLDISGKLSSPDQSYLLVYRGRVLFRNPTASALFVERAVIPFDAGILEVQNLNIPFNLKSALSFDVKVGQIDANLLVQQLSGGKASATGNLSGDIPVTLEANDTITIKDGTLRNDLPGVIQLAPDTIPGDSQPVALVKELLKDFHYSSLIIHVDNDKDQHASTRLQIEGNNPSVSNGRHVKLNINLSGNILDLVKQNMSWITDPKNLLQQGSHVKN